MAYLTSPESLNSGTNAGKASALVTTSPGNVLHVIVDDVIYTSFLADIAAGGGAGGTRSSPV